MDYSDIANSGLADCEVKNICIDYANNCIVIELKSSNGMQHTLKIDNFEEINISKKEPSIKTALM